MIRILVVDEHPVVLAGIRAILRVESDLLVDTATDVRSAIEALDGGSPDIILSEIHLQDGTDGLDLLRRGRHSRAAFIMFSAYAFPSFFFEAVAGGAAGFLSKTTPPDEIVRSIRIVAQGGTAFSAAALDGARAARRRPARRELEIVALVAEGRTNAEISRGLSIGLPTVEGVLRRLFDRYSVANRTALARLAEAEGWLFGLDRPATS